MQGNSISIKYAVYAGIILHFARKIVSRASACNPRVLRRRELDKGGSVRFMYTPSPKGSFFAERYLYDEKDKDKLKEGYNIAAFYPSIIECDYTFQLLNPESAKVECRGVRG